MVRCTVRATAFRLILEKFLTYGFTGSQQQGSHLNVLVLDCHTAGIRFCTGYQVSYCAVVSCYSSFLNFIRPSFLAFDIRAHNIPKITMPPAAAITPGNPVTLAAEPSAVLTAVCDVEILVVTEPSSPVLVTVLEMVVELKSPVVVGFATAAVFWGSAGLRSTVVEVASPETVSVVTGCCAETRRAEARIVTRVGSCMAA